VGDCPNFRSTKMGLSPLELRQLLIRRSEATCVMAPYWTTLVSISGRPFGNVRRAASVQAISTGSVQMAEGTIKRLTDKGFGFISTGGGEDMFFHSSSLQGVSFDALREGQKVTYTEGRGPKGPRAENVTPV